MEPKDVVPVSKNIGEGSVSRVKNTWVFFDDKFSMIVHTGWTGFSLLPEWIDRMEDYLEYRVVNKHGKEIKA